MRFVSAMCLGLLAVCFTGHTVHAEIIADARANWTGGTQGPRWFYGYYDRTADLAAGGNGVYDNTKFDRFRGGPGASCETGANNDWYFGVWVYRPCDGFPLTEIGSEEMWPNQFKGEQFAVMRWDSNKTGSANLTGYFAHRTAGVSDGTIGRIFHNGVEVFSVRTLLDVQEFDVNIPMLASTDFIDFVVDYGTDYGGNDSNDGTEYSFLIDYSEVVAVVGDFNGNGVLDAADVDDLSTKVVAGTDPPTYDLNNDKKVDVADLNVWVKDLFKSWIGDANLDGEFSSTDLVTVLSSGTYEANVNAVWSTGDFDGTGRTDSSDLVAALSDGGYELGPRAAVSAVPEPASWLLLILGGLSCLRFRKR